MCTAHVQNKTNTWEKKGNISTCTNRIFFYNETIDREEMKQIKKKKPTCPETRTRSTERRNVA